MTKIVISLVIKIQSHMFRKNKKTTIASIFAALGLAFINHPNGYIQVAAQALASLSTVILGKAAADGGN